MIEPWSTNVNVLLPPKNDQSLITMELQWIPKVLWVNTVMGQNLLVESKFQFSSMQLIIASNLIKTFSQTRKTHKQSKGILPA
jgi:hypothetical protein